MKKATRKIYLSIIFVTLSLLTMVATTFAWVGIVSNASFERFTINLETDNEKSDYGVMLSLTGRPDDFHDTIEVIDLQKAILQRMGVEDSKLKNDVAIRSLFNQIKLSQCTTIKDFDDSQITDPKFKCYTLDPFKDLYGNVPYATVNGTKTDYKGYFEFDVYVTIYRIGDDDNSSENKLSIYLRNGDTGLLSGEKCSTYIANEIVMPNSSNPLSSQYLSAANNFTPGKSVHGYVTVNSASAARVAIRKATAVKYGKYQASENNWYTGLNIYKYGSDNPTYDSRYDLYDFGGILPSEFNFARLQYNSLRENSATDSQLGNVPTEALPEKRGDVTFVDDGDVNHIVDENDGVTTSDMIKLNVSFWFEGWDSDCFEAINDIPVTLNLNFSTKSPKDAS